MYARYTLCTFFLCVLPWWRPRRNTHLDSYFLDQERLATETTQTAFESKDEVPHEDDRGAGAEAIHNDVDVDELRRDGAHLHQD